MAGPTAAPAAPRTVPSAGPGTRRRRFARTAAAAALLAALLALGVPVPADAHIAGSSGSPTNQTASVTAIRPSVPGLEVRVGLGGQWLRISDNGAHDILVLGYHGEPFLRMSRGQVQVNQLSSTAVDTGQTRGQAAASPAAPPNAPRWVTARDGTDAAWADARVDTPPGTVGTTVSWTVPMVVDGQPVKVAGTTERLAAPSPWPWTAALVLLAAAVAALGWSRAWHRPVAAVIVLGCAAFELHLLGTGLAPQQSAGITGWAGVAAVGAFAAVISAVTVLSIARRARLAADRVITTGIMVLLLAATDISALWNSQLPFAGPAALDRGLVVATYATALGLLVAGIRQNRLARRAAPARSAAEPVAG